MRVFRRSHRRVGIVVIWFVTPLNLDHEDGSSMLRRNSFIRLEYYMVSLPRGP